MAKAKTDPPPLGFCTAVNDVGNIRHRHTQCNREATHMYFNHPKGPQGCYWLHYTAAHNKQRVRPVRWVVDGALVFRD